MPRKRKSVDQKRVYRIPKPLVDGLKDKLQSVNETRITELQLWKHLELIEQIALRQKEEPMSCGFVAMDAKTLVHTISSAYKKYMLNLERAGIIESKKDVLGRPKFSVLNHESIRYRLTETYRNEPLEEMEGAKRVFINRPKKDATDTATKQLLASVQYPEYSLLKDSLHQISVDVTAFKKEADLWLREGVLVKGRPFTEVLLADYLDKINKVNGDSILFKVGFGGRVYTDFAYLPRVVRKFVRVHGYEGTLYQSDLKSAHLLLAVPMLGEYRQSLHKASDQMEIDAVLRMITSGKFYEVISNELRAEGVSIDNEKKDFLKNVWNAEEYLYQVSTPYRKAFNRLFPTFMKFIREQKQGWNGKSQSARHMTKLESTLFNQKIVHRVSTELGRDTVLLGIFDALVYKQEDRADIERIMEEEIFKMTGVSGMVETTTLSEESDKKVIFPNQAFNPVFEQNTVRSDGIDYSSYFPLDNKVVTLKFDELRNWTINQIM